MYLICTRPGFDSEFLQSTFFETLILKTNYDFSPYLYIYIERERERDTRIVILVQKMLIMEGFEVWNKLCPDVKKKASCQ